MQHQITTGSGSLAPGRWAQILSTIALIILVSWMRPEKVLGFWPFSAAATEQVAPPSIKEAEPTLAEEFDGKIKAMAGQLFTNLDDRDPQNGALADGLAVCTFVDLKKLYRTSSFGRYLAEQLMSEFQKQGYDVVELRKTNTLLIQAERGEYSLSRDPAELNATIAAGAVLTGTYTMADDYIIVNAKILSNDNAVMLSSATVIFPRNPLSNQLMADASSSTTRKSGENAVIYMKELELLSRAARE